MKNDNKQATGKVISYSATAAHAALTVLELKVMQEIVEAINPVIADGFALYEKNKNIYLNPAVSRNRDYQLLFDEQAREIFASMDSLAEQVRQIGATTVRSISHTGELQSVESYTDDFLSPGKMIAELINDNQQIAASLRAGVKICEKLCDTPISIILQDILDKTERRIKFLSDTQIKC